MACSGDDDDDDPVVFEHGRARLRSRFEIDMCLAKALAERLFLFQYPVRPSSLSYDHTQHLAARMKPKQQKVELELGMDINASTYCFPRGEQIAEVVDRVVEGSNQKPFFPSHVMDRHVLTSTRATQDSSKYAAAIYSNGVLHITPVKGIVQLRPGFHYFDKAEENQKKAAATALKNANDDSQDEEEAELKPVQMRFAKTAAQVKRNLAPTNQLPEEEWIEMQFHQPHDHRSKMERNLLYCHQDDFESPEFTVTSRDYLKMLSPPMEEDTSSPAAMPHGVLSIVKLKTMPFTDQVKALLRTAKVLQFTQLCALLGGGLEDKVVLKALEQYAMLVQGCWVVKSEVLHPEGSKSQISGVDAEKIWPTRDYVMFCFNRKRLLSRKEVSSTSRLPTEELREVLEQMARQRPAQGWEFMLSTDNDFLQRHPEVSLSQLRIWKQKFRGMMEHLHISEDFFNESDFKESDFPGIFPQLHRKPNTPRRKISISSDSPDKNKTKPQRRRSKSQSSQDGGDPQPPRTHRKSQSSDNDSQQPAHRKSQNSDVEMVVKEEPTSPNKLTGGGKKTRKANNSQKPRSSKNITKELLENTEVSEELNDINVRKKPNKRRKVRCIDSDDELNISSKEEIIQVTEKPGNEVEVDASTTCSTTDPNLMQLSDNGDDIFIPPVAAGTKSCTGVKIKREKPPSEIFIKELKKFIRNSIRSGCVSLGELKVVLSMKQKEPGNILCTGVEDDLLIKCVLETGAIEVPLEWGEDCQVPIDRQRVFLYRTLNEATDKFRMVVVDMFVGKLSLKKKEILERLTAEVGEVPTYHTYSKFMSEFCENHNAQWYLHGTYQSLQKY